MTKYKETLEWFSKQMSAKLKENIHKTPWTEDSTSTLFGRLLSEVAELVDVLFSPNYEAIVRECADVANRAMMIADQALKQKLQDERVRVK